MQELIERLRSYLPLGLECHWSQASKNYVIAFDLIESQAAEIEKYKALGDQMGNALEEVTALALCGKKDQLPGRCDQITKIAYKNLEAWRALK